MLEQTLLARRLAQAGTLILDGGFATELEARGHDLRDHLWSARLLRDDPAAVAAVHDAYLDAGADCILTASYQATLPGFARAGIDSAAGTALLQRAVRLAQARRDAFQADPARRGGRVAPLVAASIGPYGAFLANGAEYTGDYDRDRAGLRAFHSARWAILAAAAPDVMACETIPSLAEAQALAELAQTTPELPVWITFSCRDEAHISDGTPLAACARYLNAFPSVVGVGVNCTAPSLLPGLLRRLRAVTDKLIVVYPNSGERYDAAARCWVGERESAEFARQAVVWRDLGARIIGGCCRTTPDHIRALRAALVPPVAG